MIAVSFPCHPDNYPKKTHYFWAALSNCVYYGLRKVFGDEVRYFTPDSVINLGPRDILISNVSGNLVRNKSRSILIDAINMDDSRFDGRFTKYGMNYPTDHTSLVEGVLASILKTNDVTIARNKAGDPSMARHRDLLLRCGNVHLIQHPIDKSYFTAKYAPERRFDKARILVYNAPPRKNGVELVALLRDMGYGNDDFRVVSTINKAREDDFLLRRYMIFGHISVSEGFPNLASEFVCQGMILYGHEEWWDGLGDSRLTFTYDPKRTEENAAKIRFLLDKQNLDEVHAIRKRLHDAHVNRTDNNWSHLVELVVEEVRKHR